MVGIRKLSTATFVSDLDNPPRELDTKTGEFLSEQELLKRQKKSSRQKKKPKHPIHRRINLKFLQPQLTEDQSQQVLNLISQDEGLDDRAKAYMEKLEKSEHKDKV